MAIKLLLFTVLLHTTQIFIRKSVTDEIEEEDGDGIVIKDIEDLNLDETEVEDLKKSLIEQIEKGNFFSMGDTEDKNNKKDK